MAPLHVPFIYLPRPSVPFAITPLPSALHPSLAPSLHPTLSLFTHSDVPLCSTQDPQCYSHWQSDQLFLSHTNIQRHTHTQTHTHTQENTPVSPYTDTHTYTNRDLHTQTNTHIHVHIHAHTHTHMHIPALTSALRSFTNDVTQSSPFTHLRT